MHVEISARMIAIQLSQMATMKSEKMPTYSARAHGVVLLTYSLSTRVIPNIIDIPELTTVILEAEGRGVGPYNIKAIGETPNAPTAPAIANAVADAIGVRVRDLPITAEKVHEALRAKG